MEAKDIISAIGTLVAISLGIYNFVVARQADRVRLLVKPKAAELIGIGPSGHHRYKYTQNEFNLSVQGPSHEQLAIEVVNMSKFSVTLTELGLKSKRRKNRLALTNPTYMDDLGWPRKLEPRESITVHFALTPLLDAPSLSTVTHAYARTTCDSLCMGRSKALEDLVRGIS